MHRIFSMLTYCTHILKSLGTTGDQIIQVTQAVSDGFQKQQRSVMTLLDLKACLASKTPKHSDIKRTK